MLKDLSGIGSLQDSLAKTNELLTDVLAELKETNSERLEAIATAIHELNITLEQSSPGKEWLLATRRLGLTCLRELPATVREPGAVLDEDVDVSARPGQTAAHISPSARGERLFAFGGRFVGATLGQ